MNFFEEIVKLYMAAQKTFFKEVTFLLALFIRAISQGGILL